MKKFLAEKQTKDDKVDNKFIATIFGGFEGDDNLSISGLIKNNVSL